MNCRENHLELQRLRLEESGTYRYCTLETALLANSAGQKKGSLLAPTLNNENSLTSYPVLSTKYGFLLAPNLMN